MTTHAPPEPAAPRAGTRPGVTADELVRPTWRRLRLWLVLAGVLVVAGVVLGTLLDNPGSPLDPNSTDPDGSRALVHVLAGYGAPVSTTTSLRTALARGTSAAVVVTAPDDYSDAQLRRLTSSARRVVLVVPGTRASAAALSGLSPDPGREPRGEPGCPDAGAQAAGEVALPGGTTSYLAPRGATSCYGGALVVATRVAVLASATLLQNSALDDQGVAALDVNTITDGRTIDAVVWLRPGADASGAGAASIWDLFPAGVYRAFWFVIGLGGLIVLWRARRLGGVVTEALPVVVRASEVVEGHGRLYLRAGAADRAAHALRAATVRRLGARLALPRSTDAHRVALAVEPVVGRGPAEVSHLLAGPAPADDAGLLRLATELDRLEAALGASSEAPTEGPTG